MQTPYNIVGYTPGGGSGSGPDITEALLEPTGFPDRTDSTFSFTEATRTFTIQPSATSFTVWQKGKKYTISSAQSVVLSTALGIHAVYFDEGVLKEFPTPSSPDITNLIIHYPTVAYLYWDGTKQIYLADERHGTQMDGMTHAHTHFFQGTQYASGLTVSLNSPADGSGNIDADAQIAITGGTMVDEDLNIVIIDGAPQTLSPILQASIVYVVPTGSAVDAPTGFPVKRFSPTGLLAYNDVATQSQVEVTNNDFVLSHIFGTNDINEPVIAIQGQASYVNLGAARQGATVEVQNLISGGLLFEEFHPIATIIFQTSNSHTNTVKARIRTTEEGDDYIDWRYSTFAFAGGSAASHGALSGLNNDDHLQYALMAGRLGGQDLLGLVSWSIETWTAGATLGDHRTVLLDGSTSAVVAQLPPAAERTGSVYVIKCINTTSQCEIATDGTETLDGVSTNRVLALNESLIVQSDGTDWWALNN